MTVRIVSNEAAFRQALFAHLAANLEDAAQLLEDEIKQVIGIQGPPRSTPGNPPHMDTQELRDSIDHGPVDMANLTVQVGSDSDHALAMELGVGGRIAPRPYMVSTLINKSDEIGREICKP
jgi:hypothetical protein